MASIYLKKYCYFVFLLLVFSCSLSSGIYARTFFDSISLGLEKEIGYISYRIILSRQPVKRLSDLELSKMNTVFERMVNQSNRKHELEFKLIILDDNRINAFALPGGYIFVNSGLLSSVKNESELAGILGHEIAHIDWRHSMKAISRTTGMALFFNLVLENSVSEKKELIQRAALISLNLIQLGYSRKAEFEADGYGVSLMKKAGYSPERLLEFWYNINEEIKNNVQLPKFFDLLATHPPVKERIKNMQEIIMR